PRCARRWPAGGRWSCARTIWCARRCPRARPEPSALTREHPAGRVNGVRRPRPTRALVEMEPTLRARLPTLVASIVARLEQSTSASLSGLTVPEESVRRLVQRNVEYLLAAVTSRGDVDPAAPIDSGRFRARQGMPLADMLRNFRIGFAQFWEVVGDEMVRDGRW